MKTFRSKTPKIILILGFFVFFVMPIHATDTSEYWPAETWRTSTLEAQGMDSGYLVKLLNDIQSNDMNVHSIIIIRHGYVVMEAYAEPFGKDVLHTLHSGTKSFTSSLVGIAIREGYIKSLDQKVVDIFSDQKIKNMDDNKRQITIEHLLTMSSGIEWGIWDSNIDDYMKSISWTQYFLDLPVKKQPGEFFNYNSGGVNLLMAIIQKTSGIENRWFADKFLFKPIGITNYYWQMDSQGVYIGGWGLAMTPMEMARFGYLYLKKGNWNGKQVVPSDWVLKSMTEHIKVSMGAIPDQGYGFLWWGLPFGGFTADGYCGQQIMVVPERDMVVVITASIDNKIHWQILSNLTEEYINKSIVSSGSIPENISQNAELAANIRNFENPTNDMNFTVPEMANKISGKKYILDSNPWNMKTIIMNFNGSSECICKEEYSYSEYKFQVGLDGKYRENRLENDLNNKEFYRGKWTGENTFEMEFYRPWVDSSKIRLTFQFDQDILRMTVESTIGEWRQELTGTMEK